MQAIREAIIEMITTRPVSTILDKASSDFIFSSLYMLLLGLTLWGIVHVSMRMRRWPKKRIMLVHTIFLVLLALLIGAANVVFWLIRRY